MAQLHSSIRWNDTDLVRALQAPYDESLRRVYSYVEPLLGKRPIGAEEYTDHDLKHSARVVQRIGQLLPPDARLNQSELYILLLAALLHDAGMWVRKEEALQLIRDDDFKEFSGGQQGDELTTVETLLSNAQLRWMGELLVQRMAASYERNRHPERLCSNTLDPTSELGTTLRTLIGSEFVDAVALVSVAHSWARDRILQDDDLRTRQIGDEVVCLRFLASLLRLGDLLDLGEGRVSTLLWSYLTPLNALSEAHWRKEASLRLDLCTPDSIQISGLFDVDRDGLVAAEAYRLAQDWLKMLRDETEGVALVLNSRIDPDHRGRLHFGRLDLDITRVRVRGLELEGQVTFQLHRERIIELLSRELYVDRSMFVRELVQNAVDATRTQMIRDKRDGQFGANLDLPEDQPWNWPETITGDSRFEITISTVTEKHNGSDYVVFSITDKGIGMSLRDIREHFLQVGKSFYTTNRYRQEFRHSPISQFGIGFLSCLAVADRIELATKRHQDPVGLRLVLQQPSEHFIVQKSDEAASGTTVKLWIKAEEIENLGLSFVPFRSTHFFSDPIELCEALSAFSVQWAAYVEFPIRRPDGLIEPRRPLSYIPSFIDEQQCDSVPVRIRSSDGREIACGRVFYDTFGETHLPVFHSVSPQTHNIASIRGIALSENRVTADNHQTLVALDFRRVPQHSLTAARTFRRGWQFFSHIGDLVCHKLRSLTVEAFRNAPIEVEAIWRFFLDRRMGVDNAPTLLPVRTSDHLEWTTWDEIVARHPRVLLVPFLVAWKGPWNHSLPCVGMSTEQLNGLQNTQSQDGQWSRPIDECALISVPQTCSAYLWPPGAETSDMAVFSELFTYCHHGLITWENSNAQRKVAGAIAIDSRLVNEEAMPEYDRSGDIWNRLGVGRYSNLDDGSLTGQAARELLDDQTSFTLAGNEVVVEIRDANDWK